MTERNSDPSGENVVPVYEVMSVVSSMTNNKWGCNGRIILAKIAQTRKAEAAGDSMADLRFEVGVTQGLHRPYCPCRTSMGVLYRWSLPLELGASERNHVFNDG